MVGRGGVGVCGRGVPVIGGICGRGALVVGGICGRGAAGVGCGRGGVLTGAAGRAGFAADVALEPRRAVPARLAFFGAALRALDLPAAVRFLAAVLRPLAAVLRPVARRAPRRRAVAAAVLRAPARFFAVDFRFVVFFVPRARRTAALAARFILFKVEAAPELRFLLLDFAMIESPSLPRPSLWTKRKHNKTRPNALNAQFSQRRLAYSGERRPAFDRS